MKRWPILRAGKFAMNGKGWIALKYITSHATSSFTYTTKVFMGLTGKIK